MGTAQKLMTADEFMLLPDPEDGGKLELVQTSDDAAFALDGFALPLDTLFG